MSDPFLPERWRRHVPPSPAVVVVSSVMFLAGLVGAGIAIAGDKILQRLVQGR